MFGGNVHIKFEVEKAKAAQLMIDDTGSNRSPKTSTGSVVRKEVSTSGFKNRDKNTPQTTRGASVSNMSVSVPGCQGQKRYRSGKAST